MAFYLQRRSSDGALLKHADGTLMGECCCVETCTHEGCSSAQPRFVAIYHGDTLLYTLEWVSCDHYLYTLNESEGVLMEYTAGTWFIAEEILAALFGGASLAGDGCTPEGAYTAAEGTGLELEGETLDVVAV